MKKVLLLIATAILALSGCREKVEPVYVDSLGNFNDATYNNCVSLVARLMTTAIDIWIWSNVITPIMQI